MSAEEPSEYKLDHLPVVAKQIREIARIAKTAGMKQRFIGIMQEALQRLQSNPENWGDPSHHTAADGVVFHGILRPVVFRYAIYQQVHAVVLLEVRLYAKFD